MARQPTLRLGRKVVWLRKIRAVSMYLYGICGVMMVGSVWYAYGINICTYTNTMHNIKTTNTYQKNCKKYSEVLQVFQGFVFG